MPPTTVKEACPLCFEFYSMSYLAKHLKKHRIGKSKLINKEISLSCQCGEIVTKSHISRHKKSRKHKDFNIKVAKIKQNEEMDRMFPKQCFSSPSKKVSFWSLNYQSAKDPYNIEPNKLLCFQEKQNHEINLQSQVEIVLPQKNEKILYKNGKEPIDFNNGGTTEVINQQKSFLLQELDLKVRYNGQNLDFRSLLNSQRYSVKQLERFHSIAQPCFLKMRQTCNILSYFSLKKQLIAYEIIMFYVLRSGKITHLIKYTLTFLTLACKIEDRDMEALKQVCINYDQFISKKQFSEIADHIWHRFNHKMPITCLIENFIEARKNIFGKNQRIIQKKIKSCYQLLIFCFLKLELRYLVDLQKLIQCIMMKKAQKLSELCRKNKDALILSRHIDQRYEEQLQKKNNILYMLP